MNVWMKVQPLVPGVKHSGESIALNSEPLRCCESLGKCPGARSEKRIESLLCLPPEEQLPEFLWECEGDHKIGSVDPLVEFALDPLCSSGATAEWAGPVVATMEGKLPLPTNCADMKMPAHHRGAAMGYRPDRALLRLVKDGTFLQVIW